MKVPKLLRSVDRRVAIRSVFVVVLLVFGASAGAGYLATTSDVSKSDIQEQADRPFDERESLVESRANATVVTTSPRESAPGSIIAFTADGRVAYYNDTYAKYFDVDPDPGGDMTVEYVAGTELGTKNCPASGLDPCSIIVIERVNLTTGELTRIHERHVPGSSIWHDVERLDEHRFLVGDITTDSVFVFNVTSGVTTWRWDARVDYPIESGGQVDDWTHLNDVESLGDGRYMASLRNQDQVVFLDQQTGLVREKTLGEDGNYSVLFEQHNPDYIPEDEGGEAVLVGDSENNRIVEYQWTNGSWDRTWQWSDTRMQWPRDADRLPNGHTLVADSNGNRIFELDRNGRIVWQVRVDTPYEVERLGTGDESTGGESARELDLPSRAEGATAETDDRSSSENVFDGVVLFLKGLFPSIVENALLFVLPAWVNAQIFLSGVAVLLGALVWGGVELYWSSWTIEFGVTRRE